MTKNNPIKKVLITQVDNGFVMKIDLNSIDRIEFVETSMEGILLLLYRLQETIRERSERAKRESPKGQKK